MSSANRQRCRRSLAAHELDGVSRVRVVHAVRAGHSVVSAAVRPRAVDALLEALRRQGVPAADITLTRVEVVGSLATGPAEASLVWADVLGTAWLNARPIARYLAFMFVAGVIACYGVIDDNVILIVGAMAVSPDLLPITAIGVGIVGRRPALAGRALLTLALGLAIASAAAAIFALAQDGSTSSRPASTCNETGVLGSLTTVNDETIAVALAAGVAGHAGARDPRQLGRRRGDLGDDDPRRRLPGRRGRAGRVRRRPRARSACSARTSR